MSIYDFIPLYLSHGMMHHQTVSAGTGDDATQRGKWHQFYAGIQRILTTPHSNQNNLPPASWQHGSTTLHHYAADGAPVLLIPSLINRATVFDLHTHRSMARCLAAQGLDTYILNWNEPTAAEHGFDVADYVTQRLIPAIGHLSDTTGQPVSLVGYCMGGMMSLAAAQVQPEHVKQQALLATPWDFSTAVHHLNPHKNGYAQWLELLCNNTPIISGSLIHQLLYYANPWVVYDKYCKLASIPAGSEHETSVLEREHWLHDTVDLTSPAARNCLLEWPLDNTPHAGQWTVADGAITPQQINTRSLIVSAEFDAIIPLASTQPLLDTLPHINHMQVASGHIGMVAGHHAKHSLWIPLANWLKNE